MDELSENSKILNSQERNIAHLIVKLLPALGASPPDPLTSGFTPISH